MSEKQTVIIVGASARAAAASALRAGFRPWCLDLFADRDLAARCSVTCLDAARYPQNLLAELPHAPPGPWMYTGGLENHPALIDRLARNRPLWGNRAFALRLVRDPVRLVALLRRNGLATPDVTTEPLPEHDRTAWVAKPIRGAGGTGIRFRSPGDRPERSLYWQRFVEGSSFSAQYVAIDGRARLVGLTRQLIGIPWLNAKPFAYSGCIGPIAATPALTDQLIAIGQTLARDAGLAGVFGVDLVIQNETPWVIEVNPRYTASIEILEFALGDAVLTDHARAFGGEPPVCIAGPAINAMIGKAILFATKELSFPDALPGLDAGIVIEGRTIAPAFGDIPAPGTMIRPGWPILTMFAAGPTEREVEQRLRSITNSLQQRFDRRTFGS